jgi:hypothetical protein
LNRGQLEGIGFTAGDITAVINRNIVNESLVADVSCVMWSGDNTEESSVIIFVTDDN